MCSKYTDHRIRDSCAKSPADSDQCRDQSRILKSRLHNKQASYKCQEYAGPLYRRDLFFQNQK